MRRSPATIVILAWNAWESTEACLDSLRPTLGVRDQVVVVDNGSTDATPRRLGRYPWIEVVTNPENRGFAGGCNDGAALARHDILVFLNNDTVLSRPVARSPDRARSTRTPPSGPPGRGRTSCRGPRWPREPRICRGDMPGMRRFARDLGPGPPGPDVGDRAAGRLLPGRAPRPSSRNWADSTPPTASAGTRTTTCAGASWHPVIVCCIAHESFVHHEGHQTFDANGLDWYAEQETNRDRFESRFGLGRSSRDVIKVSACLITKDEEDNIATCLASLDGFVDEIVVYDTGSTDDTVTHRPGARRHRDRGVLGRRLLPGPQRRARTLLGGVDRLAGRRRDARLRRRRRTPAPSASTWTPTSTASPSPSTTSPGSGVGSGFVHSACRLFRRARCEWTGRLHEQVAGRGDHRGIQQVPLWKAPGSCTPATSTRPCGPGTRPSGTSGWPRPRWPRPTGGRRGSHSPAWAAPTSPPVDSKRRSTTAERRSTTPDNLITRRLAIRTAAEALTYLGRFDEALEWIESLRADLHDVGAGRHRRGQDPIGPGAIPSRPWTCSIGSASASSTTTASRSAGHMFAVQRAEALEGLGRTERCRRRPARGPGRPGRDRRPSRHPGGLPAAGRADRFDELAAAIPAAKAPGLPGPGPATRPRHGRRGARGVLRADGRRPRVVLATAATLARVVCPSTGP